MLIYASFQAPNKKVSSSSKKKSNFSTVEKHFKNAGFFDFFQVFYGNSVKCKLEMHE